MIILNIIDTIYESKYFPTVLIISIIVLVVLFIAVIILGLKDSKKAKNPHKESLLDIKDITFETTPEQEAIKEDVTFEIPVLTKNLENFKKSLEEEIEREEQINVIKKTSDTIEETKPTKILDKNKIENTAIIPIIDIEEKNNETSTEQEKHFQKEQPIKREIIKEIFREHKEKDLPKAEKEEIMPALKEINTEKMPEKNKKETKYSGDDDF